MLIDWFTVAAQTLNFLVLLWLLQRFLYKPILSAVDARESRIASELSDAATKKAEAQKQSDAFEQKNDAFDQERVGLLQKATDDVKTERQRLLDEAGKAADALTASRQESLRAESQSLKVAIARRAQDEVFAIARKLLTDLAATNLDERMVEVFVRQLAGMDASAKVTLASTLTSMSEPAVLRSAFDLPSAQRMTIQNALKATFATTIPLRFETAPDLIAGIELSANGQKVSWSIADYLATLTKIINELVVVRDQAPPITASKIRVSVPEPKVL